MSREMAERVWAALKEGGAVTSDSWRENFLHLQTSENPPIEYRFMGALGFGGKFWRNHNGWYVNCYLEDDTPETSEICQRTNDLLAPLRKEAFRARGDAGGQR